MQDDQVEKSTGGFQVMPNPEWVEPLVTPGANFVCTRGGNGVHCPGAPTYALHATWRRLRWAGQEHYIEVQVVGHLARTLTV